MFLKGVSTLDFENVNICIAGLQKSSLIDYPEKIAAIIFTQGCNFACPYCHNPEIISTTGATAFAVAPVVEFLNSRKGKLEGVVITGGEPTINKDLPTFIKLIKDLGFSVKLDTNGTNPQVIKKLLDEKLIDYVAMDIKAPIEKYSAVVRKNINVKNILKSIELLKKSDIKYEFRTTVVKTQLSPDDFDLIGKMISNAPKYYLQRFVPSKTLDETFMSEETYTDEEFEPIIKNLRQYVKFVDLR